MLKSLQNKIFKTMSSPRLTVFVLFYSIILIFFATLEQGIIGIESAQERYFESFFCLYPFEPFFGWLRIPLLGGASVGALVIVNIIASGFRYRRGGFEGFWMTSIHMALVLMIFSGFIQQYTRVQASLKLAEGETSNILLLDPHGHVGVKKYTLPFSIKLEDFEMKLWKGSNIAKEYSSAITITHGKNTLPYVIEMNKPVSFGGWTFYQTSYEAGGKISILTAVRNPAKILPAFAIAFAFLGMLMIFIYRFFLTKRTS